MGIINWLFGDGVAKTAEVIGNAVNKHKELDQAPEMAQAEINKVEAASPHWFVSGWRPFIGWELGFCLGLYLIPVVCIATTVWVINYIHTGILGQYPIDMEPVWKLLCALLGFNWSLRTLEKIKGVAR